jgi:hypothetical protein
MDSMHSLRVGNLPFRYIYIVFRLF